MAATDVADIARLPKLERLVLQDFDPTPEVLFILSSLKGLKELRIIPSLDQQGVPAAELCHWIDLVNGLPELQIITSIFSNEIINHMASKRHRLLDSN